jgi:hypothetical protein
VLNVRPVLKVRTEASAEGQERPVLKARTEASAEGQERGQC